MLADLPSVTTARAAEIVGIGYEGLRSYLKRGLLERVGMLPGFCGPFSPSPDDPAPRAKWKRFCATDLCLMRAAKMLMDRGFSFATANMIVSNDRLWHILVNDEEPTDRWLLVWPPYGDNILYDADQLHLLSTDLATVKDIATLVNLGDIQRHVLAGLRDDAAEVSVSRGG